MLRPDPATPALHERDLALADAVSRKDRKATAEFVEQHADAVYAYVLARVRPRVADADDLAQEVFLAACRSIAEYRGAASLRAWLLGIARHKVEDYYRARVGESNLDDTIPEISTDVPLDSLLDGQRLHVRIRAILDRLPEQYRLLLKWRYWDQRGTAEISTMLRRTPKSVERMLARARQSFRREWEAS